MLPDMSDVLTEWAQPVILKTAVRTTVDFEESVVITPQNITAVVQPADKEKLNADTIDWSLRYYTFHSTTAIDVGQYIEYRGVNYKIVPAGHYNDYGFSEVVGEEVKGDIV